MDPYQWLAVGVVAAEWLLRILLAIRVIMRRGSVGVSLSWLAVILLVPILGALVYLFVGEVRLGDRRAKMAIAIQDRYRYWHAALRRRAAADEILPPEHLPLSRQALTVTGSLPLVGNSLELITESEKVFARIIEDVDRAERTCHMLFYIWVEGGMADDLVAAVRRAAARGVSCRLLLDAVGSRQFLNGATARSLREEGVEVVAALPVSIFRLPFRRIDLRNHRKIIVLDGRLAYTGSQNIADPAIFKCDDGFGAWIDAMVRVEGPATEALEGIFAKDWELETGHGLELLAQTALEPAPTRGDAIVQVVPSGPGFRNDAIHHLLLTTIHSARHQLTMTTPYFVPDESILDALVCAANRGVSVTLIMPQTPDSLVVRLAARSHVADLAQAGVHIRFFDAGLLHTKTVTVDDELCLIGSVNLDMRSFWLNFEVTMFVYDRAFAAAARAMQEQYADRSTTVCLKEWMARPMHRRLIENTARLLSPLL